jgi:hypothetical protein
MLARFKGPLACYTKIVPDICAILHLKVNKLTLTRYSFNPPRFYPVKAGTSLLGISAR